MSLRPVCGAGLRLLSCRDGVDRTGLAATLDQVSIIAREFNLHPAQFQPALDAMRR